MMMLLSLIVRMSPLRRFRFPLYLIALPSACFSDAFLLQPAVSTSSSLLLSSSSSSVSLITISRIVPTTATTTTQTTLSMSSSSSSSETTPSMSSSSDNPTQPIPSWTDLQSSLSKTAVGAALDKEVVRRQQGIGAPHVHNKLRLFHQQEQLPTLTLYRDHAGWCPYCQKTMLLIEAKQIPISIELINMRSYGDKPSSFLQKVPNGLLPALEVTNNNNSRVITESSIIMELLDEWHPINEGYKQMVPNPQTQPNDYRRYKELSQLERQLFSWWCTVMFRPEQTPGRSDDRRGGVGGVLSGLLGGRGNNAGGGVMMSSAMEGFLDCLERVDTALKSTKGPFFLDYTTSSHPTMIDFVFASHVERMLASCAYWKGMDLRNPKDYPNLNALQTWIDALEKEEYYLAFKSDYYTHVKDIPPQYGPGYDGIIRQDKITQYQDHILGRTTSSSSGGSSAATTGSSSSWKLPLPHDDFLQPLYRGPPLPLCVLEAVGIQPDTTTTTTTTTNTTGGSYEQADPTTMRYACRQMAAWKLASNGPKVATFAARGGPSGSRNIRKTFGAELADPYAESDQSVVDAVDVALRVTGLALSDVDDDDTTTTSSSSSLLPSPKYVAMLQKSVPPSKVKGVVSSLAYLRDRIGVPRDLPLASARYLRAYLNWAIDTLQQQP